jgi:hypothetical protein
MGFAHSVIEDTIVVMSLGADLHGVFTGRLIFAVVACAAIAALLYRLPDEAFFTRMFQLQTAQTEQG